MEAPWAPRDHLTPARDAAVVALNNPDRPGPHPAFAGEVVVRYRGRAGSGRGRVFARLHRPVQRGPADLEVPGDGGDRLAASLPSQGGGTQYIDTSHNLPAQGQAFQPSVDFRAAYLRHWSVEDAVKIDHPYYLTEPTMVAYLRSSGFEVLRSDYATDHLHVSYVCRPCTADADVMPAAASVDELLREIRFVQNTRLTT